MLMSQGNAKLQEKDFPGAIGDFSAVITAHPADGEAYLGRAYARHTSGDLSGAIEDYNQAIRLAQVMLGGKEWHPALASMYMNRGKARWDNENWSEALLDYNSALKCDPNLIMAYGNRGVVRQIIDDLPGAIADYDEMIKRAPEIGQAFHMRATARMAQGDLSGAISDFRSVIKLVPKQADFSYLAIWQLRSRQGDQPGADEELARYFKSRSNPDGKDWPAKIADFLLGRMKEEDFLQAASALPDQQNVKGHQCEAWYYSGMKRLLSHDRLVATDYFRKCVALGMKDFNEYHFAITELKALQ